VFKLSRYIFRLLVSVGVVVIASSCSTIEPPPNVAAQQYDYVVGPGDVLEVFVWGNQELSTSVTVRPDGKFTTRLVEDLEASGKSSTQLARDIEEAYAKYVKNPVVTVIVKGFSGVPEQQVRVIGASVNPLSVPFSKHMTLLDLMISVGGLTEFADGNGAVVIRQQGGEKVVYKLRLEDLIREGDISANVDLLPGDIVIIPEAWF